MRAKWNINYRTEGWQSCEKSKGDLQQSMNEAGANKGQTEEWEKLKMNDSFITVGGRRQ